MKFVSWILTLLVLLLAVSFALKNQQNTTLNLWPADIVVEAPLYLVSLGTLFVGLLLGAMIVWISHLPRRLETRRLRRDIAKLREKIEDMNATLPHAENSDAPKVKARGFLTRLRS